MYVLLDDKGAVARYPYSITDLRRDQPDTSFPVEPSDECLAGFGVYPVTLTDQPTASLAERVDHAPPVLVAGAWVQQWTVTPLPLPTGKAAIWARAKAIRDGLAEEPGATVVTPFGTVQSDAGSQRNIMGLVLMALVAKSAGAPFSEPFTMADNSVVSLDADQMIALGVAVGKRVASIHARARALRGEIEGATTRTALKNIDVKSGW